MPSAYAYGQRFVANAPCRKVFHRLLHDSVFFRMESNDTHSSFRIKQTYVSPDRGVQPFQFPVHFDADCLKSTLRRISEFPAVRSGYAVFDNFCQLPRRRYRRLFSFFDDVFRDVSRKSFVAVRKMIFAVFLRRIRSPRRTPKKIGSCPFSYRAARLSYKKIRVPRRRSDNSTRQGRQVRRRLTIRTDFSVCFQCS